MQNLRTLPDSIATLEPWNLLLVCKAGIMTKINTQSRRINTHQILIAAESKKRRRFRSERPGLKIKSKRRGFFFKQLIPKPHKSTHQIQTSKIPALGASLMMT
jgi:hypothetical protein